MITPADSQAVADHCRAVLDLPAVVLPPEYDYGHLPLCVIDAVFSIGVRYASTHNVVMRYCDRQRIRPSRGEQPSDKAEQPLSALLALYDRLGWERMADEVFENRQRTSTHNGILKAEAVLRFARVLAAHHIEWLADAHALIDDAALERDIRRIPGQRSGTSLCYFYMLVGSEEHIKPDRMMARFTETALGRALNEDEIVEGVRGAYRILKRDHPEMRLRALDYAIWRYQRDV